MVSESKVREILFRGKNKITEKWVYGSFLHLNVGRDYICDGTIWIGTLQPCKDEVIPETVGQFTGLTDKNGKRIFDGDIIKISHKPKPYEVKYKSGCYCIGINWALSHEPDCEVIGNIHDNPELLEVSHA